jgi:hypothetical protein
VIPSPPRLPASSGAPKRLLVLVAGIPGAGKSTLLRRVALDHGVAVVDSESQRVLLARVLPAGVPYRSYRPLVHLLHRIAIVHAAIAGPAVVAVHLPATGGFLRGVVAALAALTGRAAHLLWIDVDPAVALRGQTGRGRVVPSGCFEAHTRRARATSRTLRAGGLPWGYARVTVLDRSSTEVDPSVLARLVHRAAVAVRPSGGAVTAAPGK